MKKVCLFLSLLTLLSVTVFADELNQNKRYCSPEQVELSEFTILVHLDSNTVEIDKLHVDQGGIYFHEDSVRCFYCRRPLNPKNTCECPAIN